MSEQEKLPVWKASPTRWLIFPSFLTLTIALLTSTVALFSYVGKLLPYAENTLLHDVQIFISKNEVVAYGIWSITALITLGTLVKYLKIRFENYVLYEEKISYSMGILSRNIDGTDLFRVVDVGVELPLFLRIIGRGHVVVYSNDPSLESSGVKASVQTPDGRKGVYLAGIKKPMEIKDKIERYVTIERDKRGIRSTEFM
tara:strand:- start:289 stop:888 length:600 start_codon:yes stop_codon:yes gene_type:complete